jgi:phosphate transport system ATP-binding protein
MDETARIPLITEDLSAYFGTHAAVRGVNLGFPEHTVTAIIGPSGCGKSTLLRTLNRLHELAPGTSVHGRVLLDGQNIYAPEVNPVELRKRVGMVFQRPMPFPTMSVFENVAAGLRVNGRPSRHEIEAAVERALRGAALWGEVHDRLHTSAIALSGGQQQRLCIARAIAPEPQVILLDEPTSALDPISTQRIEELVQDLKQRYTLVIVTHNMQQAARVSDYTAFLYMGELVEAGPTDELFTRPTEERTESYLTGRFG